MTKTKALLAAKAPLVSPALTGTPTAPTATSGTNSTQIATTAFVTSAVASAVSGITETTLPNAIQAVEDKADTEIARVGQAGDTQVQAVNTAGAEQIRLATAQADLAEQQAVIATEKAREASGSGAAALASEQAAKSHAEQTGEDRIATEEDRVAAGESATAASGSKTAAANSATNAATSAGAALSAKQAAETAQGKAEEARDDAKGHAEQTALDRAATGAAKAEAEKAQAAIGANGANMFASPIWQKASGASVSVTPAAGSNFEVQLNGATIQPGTGDPSLTNIRPISGAGEYRSNGYYTDIVVTTNGVPKTYTIGPMSAPLYDGDVLTCSSGSTVDVSRASKCLKIVAKANIQKVSEENNEYYIPLTGNASDNYTYCTASFVAKASTSRCVARGFNALIRVPASSGIVTVEGFKNFIASNVAEFVYPLATHTTETVPISEPIPLPPGQSDKYNPQPTVIAAADGTVTVGYNMDGTAAYNTIKAAIAALGGT